METRRTIKEWEASKPSNVEYVRFCSSGGFVDKVEAYITYDRKLINGFVGNQETHIFFDSAGKCRARNGRRPEWDITFKETES